MAKKWHYLRYLRYLTRLSNNKNNNSNGHKNIKNRLIINTSINPNTFLLVTAYAFTALHAILQPIARYANRQNKNVSKSIIKIAPASQSVRKPDQEEDQLAETIT